MTLDLERKRGAEGDSEVFGPSRWRWSVQVIENQAHCNLLHVYTAFFPCISDCLFFSLMTEKHVVSPVMNTSQLHNQSVH